jgi:hypothetical protein
MRAAHMSGVPHSSGIPRGSLLSKRIRNREMQSARPDRRINVPDDEVSVFKPTSYTIDLLSGATCLAA